MKRCFRVKVSTDPRQLEDWLNAMAAKPAEGEPGYDEFLGWEGGRRFEVVSITSSTAAADILHLTAVISRMEAQEEKG